MLEDIAVMDKEPKLEGRYVNMMALPKTNTLLKIKEGFLLFSFYQNININLIKLKQSLKYKSKTFS